MQTRFLQVIYWLSVAWLAVLSYGWLFGTISTSGFIVNVLAVGWPSLLGLLICFIGDGRFLLPPRAKGSSTPRP